MDRSVFDSRVFAKFGQSKGFVGRDRSWLLAIDRFACFGRHLHEPGTMQGGTGIEKDLVIGIGQGLVQVGRPALDSGPFGLGAELVLVSSGKDRINRDDLVR